MMAASSGIGEPLFDERLELRIGEELAPAQIAQVERVGRLDTRAIEVVGHDLRAAI